MSYPNIASFLGVDPANHDLRESIRQDLLIERYTDLQQEIKHLENLLDISEEDHIDVLYDINDSLFELLETIVPELTMTTTDEDDIKEQPADAETRIKMRKNQVKQREIKAVKIAKGAEELIRAKSSIKTARLAIKGAGSPDSKSKAQKDLVKARGNLRSVGAKSAADKKA